MTEGFRVEPFVDLPDGEKETPQYRFQDDEHYVRGSLECDRALAAGHLEVVPNELVDWALATGYVHPWTVVHQSADKWRAAQDYSVGTNRRMVTKPFTLSSVREVRRVVTPGRTRFVKYDLRDGFWIAPTHQSSRPHLMVRHPSTGRLLWCRSRGGIAPPQKQTPEY